MNLKYILCAVLAVLFLPACASLPRSEAHASETIPVESTAAQPTPTTETEEEEMQIILKIGDTAFTVQLEDNDTAAAFATLLPIAVTMDELNGNEKYVYLADSLPTDSAVPDGIETGDVMLFGSSCLVVFYESFSTSYSYTPIGHITQIEGLKEALGSGSVSVEWSRE